MQILEIVSALSGDDKKCIVSSGSSGSDEILMGERQKHDRIFSDCFLRKESVVKI